VYDIQCLPRQIVSQVGEKRPPVQFYGRSILE